MIIICEQCGKEHDKKIGHVNRARKLGLKLFCSQTCFGLSKRKNYTEDDKKKIKSDYDKEYREKNRERLKKEKHEWFKKNYDPVQAAIYRKKRMPYHVEYCRSPQYRVWKREYDQKHVAQKRYGEFWESAILLRKLEGEYNQQEVREINNLHNKTQKRKRQWRQLKRLNYLRAR